MTIESATYVRVAVSSEVTQLLGEIETFTRRAGKARSGDLTNADKVSASLSNLEVLARRAQLRGTETCALPWGDEGRAVAADQAALSSLPKAIQAEIGLWLADGFVAVLVVDPLARGTDQARSRHQRSGLPKVFRSSDEDESAVTQLFRKQCQAGGPIMPSKMKDYALVDVLHEFVFSNTLAHEVGVVYADGSSGPDIIFGGLAADASVPIRRSMSVSLMSIRHMKMDATTHGSWFRNVDLSRRVPHGAIDADATYRSARQFEELSIRGEPIDLRVHLTGFVPALMAFYRSLTEVLRRDPYAVRVRPQFFRPGKPGNDFAESSRTWSVR